MSTTDRVHCLKCDHVYPEEKPIVKVCPKCKPNRKLINGMKPLDYAIKQAEKKLDSLKK